MHFGRCSAASHDGPDANPGQRSLRRRAQGLCRQGAGIQRAVQTSPPGPLLCLLLVWSPLKNSQTLRTGT